MENPRADKGRRLSGRDVIIEELEDVISCLHAGRVEFAPIKPGRSVHRRATSAPPTALELVPICHLPRLKLLEMILLTLFFSGWGLAAYCSENRSSVLSV